MTTSKGKLDEAGAAKAKPEAKDQQAGQVEIAPAKAPAKPAPGRRPGAGKEVPAFCWKVVGYSHGIPLVLFKSVEKEDAEAQLRRYREEKYYRDLAIHPIDTKIPLPKDVVLAPHARPEPKKPPKKAAPRKKPAPKAKAPAPAAKKKTPAKKAVAPKKKAPPKKPVKPKRKTAAKKPAKAKAKVTKSKKPRTTKKKAASRKRGAR